MNRKNRSKIIKNRKNVSSNNIYCIKRNIFFDNLEINLYLCGEKNKPNS